MGRLTVAVGLMLCASVGCSSPKRRMTDCRERARDLATLGRLSPDLVDRILAGTEPCSADRHHRGELLGIVGARARAQVVAAYASPDVAVRRASITAIVNAREPTAENFRFLAAALADPDRGVVQLALEHIDFLAHVNAHAEGTGRDASASAFVPVLEALDALVLGGDAGFRNRALVARRHFPRTILEPQAERLVDLLSDPAVQLRALREALLPVRVTALGAIARRVTQSRKQTCPDTRVWICFRH